jgi:CheY-like chemotaxis protein
MGENRWRVLVIDDDARLAKTMQRMLEDEYDVVVLAGAEEALARIAAGARFDLVLCDLMLPSTSGMEFHERLASIAPELVARVIFTTGGAYTSRAEDFLSREGIRHIDKPFVSVTWLRAVVRELLERLNGGPGDPAGGEGGAA